MNKKTTYELILCFITDIDECATDNGGCGDNVTTICTNAIGSFSCACVAGYEGTPPNCTG